MTTLTAIAPHRRSVGTRLGPLRLLRLAARDFLPLVERRVEQAARRPSWALDFDGPRIPSVGDLLDGLVVNNQCACCIETGHQEAF